MMSNNNPIWKYCTQINENINNIVCTFCGHKLQSGRITRFKFHLIGSDIKNTKICQRVPPQVKKETFYWIVRKD